MSRRRHWTRIEQELLAEFYPDWPTAWLVPHFGRSERQIYQKARSMGLRKSAQYLATPFSHRIRPGSHIGGKTRFKKGHVPPNKGLRRPGYAPGRMAETQFKKGRKPCETNTYKPIGSTRIVYGNLERKITDDRSVYPARRWRPVHLLVWEAAHGPVPRGHICVFKPGMHTNVEAEITLDRIECITKAENMRRNTIHNLPEDLVEVIRLKGAVKRRIRSRESHEKQD